MSNADLIKRARETYKRYYPSGDCNEDEFLYRMNELADALEASEKWQYALQIMFDSAQSQGRDYADERDLLRRALQIACNEACGPSSSGCSAEDYDWWLEDKRTRAAAELEKEKQS